MVNGISSENQCKCETCKTDAATQRVRKAFTHNLIMGSEPKNAYYAAIKAIDEKYNPKQDTLALSNSKGTTIPKSETFQKWYEIIDKTVPVFVKAGKDVEEIINTYEE